MTDHTSSGSKWYFVFGESGALEAVRVVCQKRTTALYRFREWGGAFRIGCILSIRMVADDVTGN